MNHGVDTLTPSNGVMRGLFDPPYQEGEGARPPITGQELHSGRNGGVEEGALSGSGAQNGPPLHITEEVSGSYTPGQAVFTICESLADGSVSRAHAEEAVFALARWREFVGLTTAGYRFGFPAIDLAARDSTPAEREGAWRRDIQTVEEAGLAEAWALLWSARPPARFHRFAPPGGVVGA